MALRAPRLGQAPAEYERRFLDTLVSELVAYFNRANAPYPHNASTLNINIDTLPTEAVLATLRSGDVYRDTTASNVLKIKP
jgi:hypothetical protein